MTARRAAALTVLVVLVVVGAHTGTWTLWHLLGWWG